jgi:hypothetical protein
MYSHRGNDSGTNLRGCPQDLQAERAAANDHFCRLHDLPRRRRSVYQPHHPVDRDPDRRFVDPPKFFVTFNAPVDISAGVTVTALGADGAPPVRIEKEKGTERALTVHAGPGAFELRLLRRQNNVTQELVDTKQIEKTPQIWVVDTNERNWADAAALRGGIASTTSPAAEPFLGATRWSLTEPDFAVAATVQDPALRSMLANALAEVGVFEQGTDREKRRILSYWTES